MVAGYVVCLYMQLVMEQSRFYTHVTQLDISKEIGTAACLKRTHTI